MFLAAPKTLDTLSTNTHCSEPHMVYPPPRSDILEKMGTHNQKIDIDVFLKKQENSLVIFWWCGLDQAKKPKKEDHSNVGKSWVSRNVIDPPETSPQSGDVSGIITISK